MIGRINKVEELKKKMEEAYELDVAGCIIDIYEEDRQNFRKRILISGVLP